MQRPPPDIPPEPVLEIAGAGFAPFTVPLADLSTLPRTEVTADFHCVAGWSATDLQWAGVAFATFYRLVIEPALPSGQVVTHFVFGGLDGFESAVEMTDAMGANVLIADRLDGRPLDSDHGAPARLVSPDQYGYMNTKHLCAVGLHTAAPTQELGTATKFSQVGLRGPLVMRHPRARVWEEERHPYLPSRVLRPLYRLAIAPGRALAARGSRRGQS